LSLGVSKNLSLNTQNLVFTLKYTNIHQNTLKYTKFSVYSKNSHNAQVKFQFPKKSCTIRILLRFWNYSTYFFRQNKNQKKYIIHNFQLRFISVYILFSKNQQIINAFIVLNVKKNQRNKKIVFEITTAKIRK
jgi:hypothetical protein